MYTESKRKRKLLLLSIVSLRSSLARRRKLEHLFQPLLLVGFAVDVVRSVEETLAKQKENKG